MYAPLGLISRMTGSSVATTRIQPESPVGVPNRPPAHVHSPVISARPMKNVLGLRAFSSGR